MQYLGASHFPFRFLRGISQFIQLFERFTAAMHPNVYVGPYVLDCANLQSFFLTLWHFGPSIILLVTL